MFIQIKVYLTEFFYQTFMLVWTQPSVCVLGIFQVTLFYTSRWQQAKCFDKWIIESFTKPICSKILKLKNFWHSNVLTYCFCICSLLLHFFSLMEQKQAQAVMFLKYKLLNINYLFIELRYWLKFVASIMADNLVW